MSISFTPRSYPAIFTDHQGTVYTTIENDGKMLRMFLPGMEVQSINFEDWDVEDGEQAVEGYRWAMEGMLSYERLRFELPLQVVHAGNVVQEVTFVGEYYFQEEAPSYNPRCRAWLRIANELVLLVEDVYNIEDALNAGYDHLLPKGALKTCLTCVWSDLEPSGGCMTNLMCFEAQDRARYLAIMSDPELSPKFRIWKAQSDLGPSVGVQGIWDCDEYSPRQGIGYCSA